MTRKATVVSISYAQHLEHKIASLQLTVSDKDDAIKRIVRERDEMRMERDQARTRINELIEEIRRLNTRASQWQSDARTSDQNTALVQAKYEAALEIIKSITGKETF